MSPSRRQFLSAAAAATAVAGSTHADAPAARRKTHIGVSTYSFWQFNRAAYRDVGT